MIYSAILLLVLNNLLVAQELPGYIQYMLNKYVVNPAVAGSNGYTSVNLTVHDQNVGMAGSPMTYALCGQTRLLSNSPILKSREIRRDPKTASRRGRVGVGIYIYNDKFGATTKTGMQLTYAYHINLENESQLSMGMSLAGFQYKIDGSLLSAQDQSDLMLNGGATQSFFIPDANFGTYYTTGDYYAGVSIMQLFGGQFKKGVDKLITIDLYRHYYLLGGYHLRLNNEFNVEPSMLLKWSRMGAQWDLSSKVYYRENYWMGLSYRTKTSMAAMFGVRVDKFYFGYAFEASFGSIMTYSSGSHEVMIGYRIGENNIRRFRWLRKDIRSFDQ